MTQRTPYEQKLHELSQAADRIAAESGASAVRVFEHLVWLHNQQVRDSEAA